MPNNVDVMYTSIEASSDIKGVLQRVLSLRIQLLGPAKVQKMRYPSKARGVRVTNTSVRVPKYTNIRGEKI